MDPNENNNLIESVRVESITIIKGELKEEPLEDANNTKQAIHLTQTNVDGIFDNSNDSTVSGQKRKYSEENSLNVQEEDRMSETSNSSKANVKRRRYSISQDAEPSDNANPVMSANISQDIQEKGSFILYVKNSANKWSPNQLIDYINEQCGTHINDSREADCNENIELKLKFTNRDSLNRVILKLKEKQVEGKLTIQVEDAQEDFQSEADTEATVQICERESEATEQTTESLQNIESDENSFYIKDEYLKSLGIKLPLSNWVTVTNFRCDKSELREVMEICGRVLVCTVVTISTKYANVMYSHPLEAVQAISMLNGRKLYGKSLKLTMNSAVDMRTLLPKGLADVGPGLGKFGIPVPDLVDQYKKFVKGKNSSIDPHLFHVDLLNKIGVSLNEDSSYVRPVYTSPTTEGNDSDVSRESSPSIQNAMVSQFGPVGQRPPRPHSNTVMNMPQFHNIAMNNQHIIRVQGPNMPMGMNNLNNPGLMQGHIPAAMFFSNCPPIPGVSDEARNIHNGSVRPGPMSGPIGPMGHGPTGPTGPRPMGPMASPSHRMPMPAHTNRFPGSVSPMMGPRQVGPSGPVGSIGQSGPISGPAMQMGPRGPRPRGPGTTAQNAPVSNIRPVMPPGPYMAQPAVPICNVQMFKGNDPVTLQISNLPPNTNFMNLGQRLSELGQVVFLEFTTPGCAVVRFANPADTERCFQNYRRVLA